MNVDGQGLRTTDSLRDEVNRASIPCHRSFTHFIHTSSACLHDSMRKFTPAGPCDPPDG